MKAIVLILLLVLSAGCAVPSAEGPDAAGYRGIEGVRILAKGME